MKVRFIHIGTKLVQNHTPNMRKSLFKMLGVQHITRIDQYEVQHGRINLLITIRKKTGFFLKLDMASSVHC
jgi:hypothetical protein